MHEDCHDPRQQTSPEVPIAHVNTTQDTPRSQRTTLGKHSIRRENLDTAFTTVRPAPMPPEEHRDTADIEGNTDSSLVRQISIPSTPQPSPLSWLMFNINITLDDVSVLNDIKTQAKGLPETTSTRPPAAGEVTTESAPNLKTQTMSSHYRHTRLITPYGTQPCQHPGCHPRHLGLHLNHHHQRKGLQNLIPVPRPRPRDQTSHR